MLFLSILSFIAAASWGAMASSGRASEAEFQPFTVPPATVDSLNTSLYLGRWYQMYSSLVPNSTYERNGSCVFADYAASKKPGVAFQLTNAQRVDGPNGRLEQVKGDALRTSEPGKFKVKFDNTARVGDYWVTAVGQPSADANGSYPWALVSAPYRTSLFILARNVQQFRAKYQSTVLRIAEEQGFTQAYNKPLETYQGADCVYAPVPKGGPSKEPPRPAALARRGLFFLRH